MPSARREDANSTTNGSEVKVEEGEVGGEVEVDAKVAKDEKAADENVEVAVEQIDAAIPPSASSALDADVAIVEVKANGDDQAEKEEVTAGIIDGAETSDAVATSSAELLAALGSAEDIAAAAIQSAGLEAILGGMSDTTHGVKRSREETDTTEAIADVPFTSSYEAPAIDAIDGDEIRVSADATSTLPTEETAATTVTAKEGEEAEAAPTLDLGDLDLNAVAQAAMGLDADGNPLPGNEESHRALAEAVKQLSAAQGVTLPHNTSNDSDDGGSTNGRGPTKRFQCTLCERKFARAYNLNTHIATHDPDPNRSKPFPCPYPSCRTEGGRSFSRKHDLQRHVASTHDGEPEPAVESVPEGVGLVQPGRKFRCDDCGRSFVRRDALKRHACTRAGEGSSSSGSMSSYNTPAYSRPQPDYLTNVAAGLSLYTSNAVPATTASTTSSSNVAAGSKTTKGSDAPANSDPGPEADPFGPNGITYENLSKEVQDMAMQLVAQAQEYNDQKESASNTSQPEVKEDATSTIDASGADGIISKQEQESIPTEAASAPSKDTTSVKEEEVAAS